ncbi:MAG: hypothetical protein ACO1TE_29255 [Prosthecobacter sp.]
MKYATTILRVPGLKPVPNHCEVLRRNSPGTPQAPLKADLVIHVRPPQGVPCNCRVCLWLRATGL